MMFSMRGTRALSVTLPPEMLKRVQSIPKRESRTMSELVREALRHYERRSWWDVGRLIHEARRGVKKAAKR
jgi:predicted transcriptional regulator